MPPFHPLPAGAFTGAKRVLRWCWRHSPFAGHQQLVDIDAKRLRQPLQIVQGNVSSLAFNVPHEGPMQPRLECQVFLRPPS